MRPDVAPLRPRDVVRIRKDHADLLSIVLRPGEPGWEKYGPVYEGDMLSAALGSGIDEEPEVAVAVASLWAERVRRGLRRGQLFLIAENMSQLISHAAASMPGFVHRDADALSKDGYCLFARPVVVGGRSADGFSWSHRIGNHGLAERHVAWWRGRDEFGGPAVCAGHFKVVDDCEWSREEHASWDQVAWTATFWQLASEEWVGIDRRVPKLSKRNAAKAKSEPEDVRVVVLRQATASSGVAGSVDGVEYSHRWWVNGHWRQQWYPSQQRHAPRWIRGHIKGPDDKPFVAKETVNVLRR